MNHQHKQSLSRRDFFKTMGTAGIATAGLAACSNENNGDERRQSDRHG